MDQAVAVLSYVGFLFLAYLIGLYVVLRWGWVGVHCIWRFRQVMDATTREDFQSGAMTERLVPQDEVDALVAAALALFAQQVAERLSTHWLSTVECNHFESTDASACACGWASEPQKNVGEAVKRWVEHAVQGLSNPSALAEHDAALREEATMVEHHNHAQFEAQLYSILVDPVEESCVPEAEWWEIMRKAAVDQRQAIVDLQDKAEKLEAENAELREAIRRHVDTGHDQFGELSALLAKSGGAK